VMRLKVLNLYESLPLLLHLFVKRCAVFYTVCLFFYDIDVKRSQQSFGDRRDVQFSISCDFCQPVMVHSVYIASPYLSSDSGPSYVILTLADVADVFVANIPQR